ncbi:MAG: phenylalanine--tRNA ligase subunit alpha [Patescibacteria group bacterium]|jgi:phenylalanyl-tRNA synthetase alpha chain|nr:phenylalanine--tRNA ligase subunit alpha [Patescibacteria group bacterium]
MQEKIDKLKKEILDSISDIKETKAIKELELFYLGRKGKLTSVLRDISSVPKERRAAMGKLANEIKNEIQAKFNEAKKRFEQTPQTDEQNDVTLPGLKQKIGHIHPITQLQYEMEDLFTSMGFTTLDGPELESDYYNFEAINIPPYHPARDTQDTFYIDKPNKEGENDLVMRTHTSSVQVRAMLKHGAPMRAIVPGRVFRSEATDARHEHTFYQVEGFVIDKDINFAHMKGILELVGKKLFGPDTKIRMRPKYYPFVEPGSNGEYTCFLCHGKGCTLCKKTGWLEILGSGMIHPNVLRAGGIDPDVYQGYAFGFGLNRLAQLKYKTDDVRLFNGGDLRFMKQF